MSVVEVINVSREVTWLPWAVQYFFLVGISAACFFMTLRGFLSGAEEQGRFARLALIGALACGIVAPVALLADLHQPGRFWRFYLHPNLGSWMAWGAFFIPAYLVSLFVYAWAALRSDLAAAATGTGLLAVLRRLLAMGGAPTPRLLRFAAVATAFFALLVLLYTGMEVMVVRARPLWHTPLLPLQFVATAVVGAAGLVLVLDRVLAPAATNAERYGTRWLVGGLVATIAFGLAWFALALLVGEEEHARALASVAHHPQWQITAAWAALATLLPLAVAWIRPVGLGWLLGLAGLHAAWMFRWTVFIGGQTVPKTGAGLYAYELPLGHDGLIGIAGTIGLWLAIFIVVSSLVPLAPAATPRAA